MTKQSESGWFVYLIRTSSSSLYCGVTTDVKRRFEEHQKNGTKTAKYLRGKQPLVLEWYQCAGSKRQAMQLEYRIKRLRKNDKERLCKDIGFWQALLRETE
ncbi:hypothetical protein CS022_03285 [Veronia nyctiphanis]|uniref:GIY-YIG domain-containing protein n=1 Tax=Veronia nyctiphanis TaxID=1278244 RepID=A0A4Q0YUV0_9GAMM|nr:GIY-YIG nuclease family protein [Veronia nyctiphanis]RXJ74605.1 hypothetical protein CS022_03285 [Veronia nyctiphanis]